MKLFICMDDTDNLQTQGTGWLVEGACREMRSMGWAEMSRISRHQLLVHSDIPYTSHNSAMVCVASTEVSPDKFIEFLGSYLEKHSAEGSDPGLCVVPEPDAQTQEELIAFGLRAKREVLTKEHAYALARRLRVHLSEHGGTGGGIIGALAGIGLYLEGNDGRYRGWFSIGEQGDVLPQAAVRSHDAVEDIRTPQGAHIPIDAPIYIAGPLKTVRMNGLSTLLVREAGANNVYSTLSLEAIKQYRP